MAATASPAAAQDKKAPQVASQSVDGSKAADYWTPDRMKSAIPGDVLADKALARGNKSPAATVEKGSSTQISGKAAKGKTTLHADESPVSNIGKVFFTMGGSNYVCSGNSVSSTNKSTVSTAGHCVNEGPGAFATNFVFVPAYLNGAAPYGKWAAKALYTPTQWSSAGDMQYDTGFAVVSPLNGQNLSDVVGASGVQFNAARGLTYKSYGYPAASPFDGQSLVSCTGPASDDPEQPAVQLPGHPLRHDRRLLRRSVVHRHQLLRLPELHQQLRLRHPLHRDVRAVLGLGDPAGVQHRRSLLRTPSPDETPPKKGTGQRGVICHPSPSTGRQVTPRCCVRGRVRCRRVASPGHALRTWQPADIIPICPPLAAKNEHVPHATSARPRTQEGHALRRWRPADIIPICPPLASKNEHVPLGLGPMPTRGREE